MQVVVVGGTGLVGSMVVAAAQAAGHQAIPLSRSSGVDVTTGEGLRAALPEGSVVVDASNVSSISRKASIAFFEAATTHLLAAEREAGVAHHVALSIVGVDRVDTGYYAGKLRQEELVRAAEVPWTIARATQFHEFPGQLLERMHGFAAFIPRMRSQTVAAREVAEWLVEVATGAPARDVVQIAGPEVAEMPDLARRLLRTRGSHKAVVPVPLPGAGGKAAVSGGLLPTGDWRHGQQTFDEWLAQGVQG